MKTIAGGLFVLVVVLIAAASPPARAGVSGGTLLWERAGTIVAVAVAGDLDGDGHGDFLVGGTLAGGEAGAEVLSGLDGSVLRAYTGLGPSFGASVCTAGDMDGDGTTDFLVSGEGFAELVSGACRTNDAGCVIRSFAADADLGGARWTVSAVGDIDGDGVTDFLIGAPDEGGGAAKLFSGASGAPLFKAKYPRGFGRFGALVGGVPDFDGDGVPELVIGAPSAKNHRIFQAGLLRIYSGRTFEVLRAWKGSQRSARVGATFASGADWNGDGVPDIAFSVPGATVLDEPLAGIVRVLSGKNYKRRLVTYGGTEAGAGFGEGLLFAGDVDGDGHQDLVLGEPRFVPTNASAETGRVTVVSGRTGAALFVEEGVPGDPCGSLLAVAGANGEGAHDLAIACRNEMRVYSLAPSLG